MESRFPRCVATIILVMIVEFLSVWPATPALAQSAPAGRSVNKTETDVAFDFFIFLDNSTTMFSRKEDGTVPSQRIADMLQQLLGAPFNQKTGRRLAAAGDRIFLYRFDANVRPFGRPIDGGNTRGWQEEIRKFGADQEKKTTGGNGPAVEPDKSDFSTLFRSIRENREIQSPSDERIRLVIIASDFVHDVSNNSSRVCDDAAAYQASRRVPAAADLNRLSQATEQLAFQSGSKPFFVNLVYDVLDPERSPEPRYVTCNREMMKTQALPTAMSTNPSIQAATIPYSRVQGDTEEFVTTVRETAYRALLPPLKLRRGLLRLENGRQLLSLEMTNDGLIENHLRNASVYRRKDSAAKDAVARTEADLQDYPVPPGETVTLDIPLTGSINPELFSPEEKFVSWTDESPKSPNTQRREPVRSQEEASLEVANAERDNVEPDKVLVTVRNSHGGPKALNKIAFRDTAQTAVVVVDSPNQTMIPPNNTLTITAFPIPPEFLRRVRSGAFQIAVTSGVTDRTSEWVDIGAVKIELLRVSTKPDPWNINNETASTDVTITNSNPFDVEVTRIQFEGGSGAKRQLTCTLPKGSKILVNGGGSSRTVNCSFSVAELSERSDLSIRLLGAANEPLSEPLSLPSWRKTPLTVISASLNTRVPGTPLIIVRVRNDDVLANPVTGVFLRRSRGVLGDDQRLEPKDRLPTIRPNEEAEISTYFPKERTDLALGTLQVGITDQMMVPEAQRSFVPLNMSGLTYPLVARTAQLDRTGFVFSVDGALAIPLTPTEIRLSASSTMDPSITLPVRAPRATTLSRPASDLRADLNVANQLALLPGATIYACVARIKEKEPTAGDAPAPCEATRFENLRPKADVLVSLDTRADGVAYSRIQQGNSVFYRLRLSLENKGDWVGLATGVRLYPYDKAEAKAVPLESEVIPLEEPVFVPAGEMKPALVRLDPDQWKKFVGAGRVHHQPRAVVTGDNKLGDGDPVNSVLAKIDIEAIAAWFQATPSSARQIVVGASLKLSRQNVSEMMDLPVTIIFNNKYKGDFDEKTVRVLIDENAASAKKLITKNFTIAPGEWNNSRPESIRVKIGNYESRDLRIEETAVTPARSNIWTGVVAVGFVGIVSYWRARRSLVLIDYIRTPIGSAGPNTILKWMEKIYTVCTGGPLRKIMTHFSPAGGGFLVLASDGLGSIFSSVWFIGMLFAVMLWIYVVFFLWVRAAFSKMTEFVIRREASDTIQHVIQVYRFWMFCCMVGVFVFFTALFVVFFAPITDDQSDFGMIPFWLYSLVQPLIHI